MSLTAELYLQSISELAPSIARGELSPVELTEGLLARIEALEPQLGSYALVTADLAMEQARSASEEIARGNYRGPLHGIPIAVKDLIYIGGLPAACGSEVLRGWRPDYDATVYKKLEDAGAIIVGKLAMTEFALSGYHPSYQPPRNPWNPNYWPGVSSSGSGVATAAGLCFAALGTDTGGSIRFPSAVNGIVGLKPSYGRVSRYGAFPLAQSLDHVGPMTRSVADAGIVLNAIAGYDVNDPTSLVSPLPDLSTFLNRDLKGLRIGFDRRYAIDLADPQVGNSILASLEVFIELGAQVVDIDIVGIADTTNFWFAQTAVEAAWDHREYFPACEQSYGPVFRELLNYGHQCKATVLVESQLAKKKARHTLQCAFQQVDVILCPSAPTPPPLVTDFGPQMVLPPEALAPIVTFTAPFNFSGHPTLSIPCGFTEDKLPLSLQLIAPLEQEQNLIMVGHAFERATDYQQTPRMAVSNAD
ncbi:MAG: Asp-tRNA(Asn)/Glu-tRNA(Gln) amidotransferase GatCAB subunit A [Gammaproteobacteria bacterium]|nr:MAG: Asp-tRNA(Asn)/Glu-tRNA(Gln) amidotransferase GatCAB subunit A [Gammaproteobacteria bacterium]